MIVAEGEGKMAQIDENMKKDEGTPFETADPFYSESNMRRLEKVISDIETGKAKLEEHELIEE